MENGSLNGTLVLVRPDLTFDPAGGQRKVGVVNYDRPQSNEIYVAFDHGREAIYPPEALVRLKDTQTILNDLTSNGSKMPLDVFKDLYKIIMLLDRGTNTGSRQALEIAGKNPAVWERALQPAKPAEKEVLKKSYSG
ncbi:hypothetical protein INP83_11180 [Mucilaginibacter sp. 21P]|uniref:hypothetical protein n=1 Tax=Mucilaginibacter sp. 21P TaxID=2778902 RepID=UPI001C563776|nr:hypothetical protein [Mucilaginibacter sp. 21P]QXV63674.1 hypothetical protein INP83_11180 [Mucilaginibacter sp. 21P]